MGKYAKKMKIQKKAVAGRSSVKQRVKKKTGGKKKDKSKKRAALSKTGASAEGKPEGAPPRPDASGDIAMDAPQAAAGAASEKVVSFLARAKTESKALEAVKKTLKTTPMPAVMGAALCHVAGRGLTTCAQLLVESRAPLDACDASQAPGRQTPLQLAASRGHVNVVRLLVQAGADRTGALEASQDLAKLGAVFAEERKAIQAALS
mmetsp:Transcript_76187/g.235904  ORF Transcript_76187/g.235904 Transcript_76187/m.235904 type:complete len:206 (-) Transcript_76187:51-668(-)